MGAATPWKRTTANGSDGWIPSGVAGDAIQPKIYEYGFVVLTDCKERADDFVRSLSLILNSIVRNGGIGGKGLTRPIN